MKRIIVKTIYNRKKTFDKDKKAPVTIEVYYPNHNGSRKFYNTGIYLTEESWDSEKNQVSRKYNNWRADQRLIDDCVRKINESENKALEMGRSFSPSDFDELFATTENISNTFIDFYRKQMENDVTLGKDIRRKKGTLAILEKFDTRKTHVSAIDYDFIEHFDAYLRNKLKLMTNTISKHHEHILSYIKIGIRKGVISPNANPYLNFKFKREKTTRDAITIDELKLLEQLNIADANMKLIRDMFVFSCYSGLRFGDVQALTNRNLVKDGDITYIITTMEKTEDKVVLPVSVLFDGKAMPIIQEYQSKGLETIFPPVSNQEANRQLKILGLTISAHNKLTFHISRHTFGTMLADKTANPFLIQKLMGHTDIKTSMEYIHLSNQNLTRQLQAVNWN